MKIGAGVGVKARATLIALLAVLLSTLATSSALGHAALLSSDPADGSVLEQFPQTISVTFNEELLKLGDNRSNYFELLDPNRNAVLLSEMEVQGPRIQAEVLDQIDQGGIFTISYRAVSGDGHVIKGEVRFEFQSQESNSVVEDATALLEQDQGQDQERDNSALILISLIAIVALTAVMIYLRSAKSQ